MIVSDPHSPRACLIDKVLPDWGQERRDISAVILTGPICCILEVCFLSPTLASVTGSWVGEHRQVSPWQGSIGEHLHRKWTGLANSILLSS